MVMNRWMSWIWLGITTRRGSFVNVLNNSSDDDEEMKMGFLMKNAGWISLEAVLEI
jgi:hypothetical protein